jgi:hypothetical protein
MMEMKSLQPHEQRVEQVHLRVRVIRYVCLAVAAAGFPMLAQVEEPILTKSAIPFGVGAGSVKFDYAGGIGRTGGNSQIVPEATLEIGIRDGLEVLARFPLLRVNLKPQDTTVIGGGQLATGARYLVAGGADRAYAVSVQAIVEAPTGDTRLVGNATQVMPEVLADWRPLSQVVIHSNLNFDRSVGGGSPKAAFLEYSNAVAWRAATHLVPAFELVGSTNTITSRTQLIALPEIILRAGSHLECKAGLQLGLNAATPALGLRAQLAWSWGPRQ